MTIFKPHQRFSILKKYVPAKPVIIEAGAYTGNDTRALLTIWPDAHIHAFEPVPELYKQLKQVTAPYASITCHQIALSNHNGTIPLHLLAKKSNPTVPSQAGSLHKPMDMPHAHKTMNYMGTIIVPIITIDTWATDNNIKQVDMLWLDLQGHELAVLEQARSLLPVIQVIYTEVNLTARYEQQPTYLQLKTYLTDHNFKEVARDFSETSTQRFGNVIFVNNNP
jgi:FkbM family methyltransferase